jgi:hypothetical protein
MQFTDPDKVQARARAVCALLPAVSKPLLSHNETRVNVAPEGYGIAVFDAVTGRIDWEDADGESREIHLPAGTTAEAVAAMLFVLAEVQDWS